MMDISIIIVNYNVKHFLEQVLLSIENSIGSLSVETIVIDNNSVDGSPEMMSEKFPNTTYIFNRKNVGFSTANNQGIKIAKGKYILLLNPDTIIEEDTLKKCFNFMESTPDAGAMGIKMIDGAGNYLRESKRALPTPEVSFYKMTGLSGLFPKSHRFGQYYMTHLSENDINPIEILPGAFMFMRSEVLKKVGLLDETFFMYGEDIDFSYRFLKTGYKNYYYPFTRVIHYKGESTKKKNFNYVKVFYNAMIIFFDKHFSNSAKDRFFAGFIKAAIYLRAFIALLTSWGKELAAPLLDAGIIYGGIYGITDYWEKNHRYVEGGSYPDIHLHILVPLYIAIWIGALFIQGAYDKPYKTSKIFRGIISGTVVVLLFYGFLEESFRFSRAIIGLGAIWALISTIGSRLIHRLSRGQSINLFEDYSKNILLVGSSQEVKRIQSILDKIQLNYNLKGYALTDKHSQSNLQVLGSAEQLDEIVDLHPVDELIFCGKDLTSQKIMDWITKLGPNYEYRIVPEDSWTVIGSHSSNSAGQLYTIDIELSIAQTENKRLKRLFDFCFSTLLLSTLPLSCLAQKKPLNFIKNIIFCLIGIKTWIGYPNQQNVALPKSKKHVLRPVMGSKNVTPENQNRIFFLYAKDYSVSTDLKLVLKHFRALGN